MTVRGSRVFTLLIASAVTVALGFAVSTTFSDDQPAYDWVAPARAARKANPIPSDDASIAAGKEVFTKNCLSCHGPTGKGDGAAAFALNPKPRDLSNPKVAQQSDGSIFWKLTEGKKPMPAFEKLTTETERWQVINFVRTLQPKAAASSSQPATQPAKNGGNP